MVDGAESLVVSDALDAFATPSAELFAVGTISRQRWWEILLVGTVIVIQLAWLAALAYGASCLL